jgi:ABC-type antimicrobial peptide transport system permease subunit
VAFYLEQQIDTNLRAGMTPAEARRRAMLQFGGVEAVKEGMRDEFRLAPLERPDRARADVGTLYDSSMARTSFTLVMLTIAATTALLLGAIGIFGAIGYLISERRREIGVRIALGAQHRQIRRVFVRYGLTMAGVGIGCGLLAALGLTRFMASVLFGIGPLDGVTYVVVAIVMFLTAALASYIPAHHATAVDPVDALRAQS